ncbi:CCN family member 2-like isoform X1 [Saccostrea echinata]|uniref:CCN family member 2-like isoform X1 n=1 Tax=Saccostrea echinata TaxID=191078 RepID=UPI002A83845A|nr:CCN family member 2-like isoform X1 [Saccostrea echinata]
MLWWCLVLILLVPPGDTSGFPCYGCSRDLRRRNQQKRQSLTRECTSPCECPFRKLTCNYGVSRLRDGCGCCMMCARQLGDICSKQNLCEPTRSLYCDIPRYSSIGICRALHPKSCNVNGVKYKDGAQFQLGCSRMCTCQNGNYGCADLCPQEHIPPSDKFCKNARLVSVSGTCCKEWSCDLANVTNKSPRHAMLKGANLLVMSEEAMKTINITEKEPKCSKEWSPCSVSCGYGLSHRYGSETCDVIKDTRICYPRPCDTSNIKPKKKRCKPTFRITKKEHIVQEEGDKICKSVRKYRLKFCSTCAQNQCCFPWKTSTRMLEFKCSDDSYKYLKYSWTKRCKCEKECPKPTFVKK